MSVRGNKKPSQGRLFTPRAESAVAFRGLFRRRFAIHRHPVQQRSGQQHQNGDNPGHDADLLKHVAVNLQRLQRIGHVFRHRHQVGDLAGNHRGAGGGQEP